jgi:limonene 1,2-monooxygenase
VDQRQLRFGAFVSPFHNCDESVSTLLERDMQLVEHLDRIGFHEFWVGEHHSGGMETIPSPELFLAAVAERTKRIKLCTGVVSLPYHNPLTVADRITQLDHQSKGRVVFGVGPGSLPSDVYMMGRDPLRIREMAEQLLDVIIPLLRGEIVDRETDFFTLRHARAQLGSFQFPHPEVVVAATASPYGPQLAGKHGAGLLSLGATSKAGFDALKTTWDIWSSEAAKHGHTVNRASWRLVGPVHIAETREQARRNVAYGLPQWIRYFKRVSALPIATEIDASLDEQIDAMAGSGMAVIGTPDDLIARIHQLWDQSGGFGCWLDMNHDWADFENTKKSYELIARFVMPSLHQGTRGRNESMEWAASNREQFLGMRAKAVQQEHDKWAEKNRKPAAE